MKNSPRCNGDFSASFDCWVNLKADIPVIVKLSDTDVQSVPTEVQDDMEIVAAPINDAARSLGVGRTKIYEMIAEGRLSTIKIGRRTLVKADSIRALVEAA